MRFTSTRAMAFAPRRCTMRHPPMRRRAPRSCIRLPVPAFGVRQTQSDQAKSPTLHWNQDTREATHSFVSAVALGGYRSVLSVPMLHEGELVGVITIFRQEVRSFNETHVSLVENFAAQAVIAIENARLLNDLRERTQQLEAQSQKWSTRAARHRPSRRNRTHGQAAALLASAGG